jgi:uncharacterized protein
MKNEKLITEFLAEKKLAIIGASRKAQKFGNTLLKELTLKGYTLYPVHPAATEIGGYKCYASLKDLPEKVGGVIIVVPPAETEKVVREVNEAGITKVWMQLGAESKAAISYCEENGIAVIYDRCVLMFAEPAQFVHRAHRWICKVTRKI